MKIFISWSGERSQKIAELFKDWIQCVIQAAKPWISSHDVDRGALWYTEISKTLADSQFGILCLTPETILIKGISISYSKNVEIECKDKDSN